jgi:hypothetical protein
METVEDAIQHWFSEATGLQTIWRNQSAPQPEYPYASLLITSGPDSIPEGFELRDLTNIGRPAGTEVEQYVCAPCLMTVSCQTYVEGEDGNKPSGNARSYLNKARAALFLPSQQALFEAAEISVVRSNPVTDISALTNERFVSRAGMDVQFNCVMNLSEYVGYIKKVAVESAALGVDEIIGDLG